ncbi:hypothetical protein LTR53_015698 [Teratosphaeriaceae sp. CCFEE 6253]|nr:hypothetical protein LTR53_015698 [Teratosphaeriaceae sp. CCFEE 6253]
MTDSATAPSARRLLRIHLEQLTSILKLADDARAKASTSHQRSWPTTTREEKGPEHEAFEKLDKEYTERLLLTRCISVLCQSAAYQRPLRITRLQALLAGCEKAGHLYVAALEDGGTDDSVRTAALLARQLPLAIESLQQAWLHHSALPPSSGYIEAAEYLDTAWYECVRVAACLREEMGTMLLEGYDWPLKTVAISRKPLDTQPALQAAEQYIDYGAVNTIWHALTNANLRDRWDTTAYFRLVGAMFAASLVEDTQGLHKTSRWSPQIFIRGLAGMDFDLGIVFHDDPATVVWPLGRAHSSSRGIIIYCVRPRSTGYSFNWRYRTLVDPMSDVAEIETNAIVTLAPTVDDATSPGPRPKSFTDLPAELRNAIYADAIGIDDWGFLWTDVMRETGCRTLPELCGVSRQIYRQVQALCLAGTAISAGYNETRWGNLDEIGGLRFDYGSYWMDTLSDEAHFRRFELAAHIPQGSEVVYITLHEDLGARGAQTIELREFSHYPGEEKAESLRELVQILLEDNGTGGLSLVDAAVMAEIIHWHTDDYVRNR